jgi:spore germination cell wall hydrolase CwlJ-like protein
MDRRNSMKLSWILSLAQMLPQPVADQTCLTTTIYLEARSEPARGQMAVAEVALRRRESGKWGGNLCKVLTAPYQFALTLTNPNYDINEADSWLRSWSIAGAAMNVFSLPEKLRMVVVPRADHFHASYVARPDWVKGPPLAVIGEHSFYAAN